MNVILPVSSQRYFSSPTLLISPCLIFSYLAATLASVKFCMTRSVLRFAVCRWRLVWSSVCRSWRGRWARSTGAWGEEEGPISRRLHLMSCGRWHYSSLINSDPSVRHLPVDSSHVQRECLKKIIWRWHEGVWIQWRVVDRTSGDVTVIHLFIFFTHLSEAMHRLMSIWCKLMSYFTNKHVVLTNIKEDTQYKGEEH